MLVQAVFDQVGSRLVKYYEYAADGSIRLTRRVTDEYFPAE